MGQTSRTMHGPDLDDDACARHRRRCVGQTKTMTRVTRGPDLDDEDEDDAWARPRR